MRFFLLILYIPFNGCLLTIYHAFYFSIQLTTREYVRLLEKCMSALSARFGIPATTNDSNIGVWIGENKIGAVGVQSSRGVTAHGFALNCSTDLAWFDRIVPCGLADKGVTSLTAEIRKSEDLKRRIGDVVTVEMVLPLAIRTLGEVLERDMVPVEQSEPELAEFVQRFLKGKR